MQVVTTITSKYQVHIPKKIRQEAGLTKHGPAIIKAEKKKIIIEPMMSNFLSLGGAFKVKKPISAEEIRRYIKYTDKK